MNHPTLPTAEVCQNGTRQDSPSFAQVSTAEPPSPPYSAFLPRTSSKASPKARGLHPPTRRVLWLGGSDP